MIGINRFINTTESWVVSISSIDTAAARLTALVHSEAFYVTGSVVAGEKSSVITIGIAGKGTTDMSSAIIGHLSEMSDVMAVLVKLYGN